jgi:hypothetical protein
MGDMSAAAKTLTEGGLDRTLQELAQFSHKIPSRLMMHFLSVVTHNRVALMYAPTSKASCRHIIADCFNPSSCIRIQPIDKAPEARDFLHDRQIAISLALGTV